MLLDEKDKGEKMNSNDELQKALFAAIEANDLEAVNVMSKETEETSFTVAEMYALWEQYQRLRTIGSKKLRKQVNEVLNTFIECFKMQAPEVRTTFIEEICTQVFDSLANAPDNFWLGGGFIETLALPIHIQSQFVSGVLVPELERLHRENPSDVQKILCLGAWCGFDFLGKSCATPKDQTILRKIIAAGMYRLGDFCHELPIGVLCNPELMNQNVAETRNYFEQLEPSILKDIWNEHLLRYERIAKCWGNYCTHKFLRDVLYDDFRHYMTVNEVEW